MGFFDSRVDLYQAMGEEEPLIETPRVGNGLTIVYREAQVSGPSHGISICCSLLLTVLSLRAQTAGFVQYQSKAQPKPVAYDYTMSYFEAEEA